MAERWYDLEGDACGHQVVEVVRGLETLVGAPMRERWMRARNMYESRDVSQDLATGAIAGAALRDDRVFTDELYNVSRAAVDTGQAEIAARNRPKPMCLTTDADWRTKRKAKRLGRFLEAVLNQPQGARYADSWELGEDIFRDAEIAIGGVVKVTIDVARERIDHTRVPAYEVLVDPVEARDGDPQNWFQHYPMDRETVKARFGNPKGASKEELLRLAAAIEAAGEMSEMNTEQALAQRTADIIRICEAWHLPPSVDKPGKHVIATTGGILVEEEYDWPWPPFAFDVWSKEAFGVWGTGLVECGANQHDKINELARNMHERIRLGCTKYIYFRPGSIDIDQQKRNDGVVFVPVLDNGGMPQESNTPPVTQAEIQLLDREYQLYFNVQGVSQMAAEARKEPGLESGVALQTVDNKAAARFLPKSRAYELFFMRLAQLDIRAMRDLAVAKPGYVARFPGKRFLETIPWKDVDMSDDMYTIRVAPVSALSSDPAERLEIVEKLVGMGFISREKYLDLLGMPDLDHLLAGETAETQWIEKIVDVYLDSEDDDDLAERGGFREPDPYLGNALMALTVTAQHYFDAMVNDAPEYNLNLIRRFMRSLQTAVKKQLANIAPPAPANQNAGMPVGQPAVPNGPPGAAVVPPAAAPPGLGAAA